jgi:hypothetical protein
MAVRKPAAAKPEPEAKTEDTPVSNGSADVEPFTAVDRVAVVTRNSDGSPRQTEGFVLVVHEDPTDEELAAAWNYKGELPPKGQPVEYVARTS